MPPVTHRRKVYTVLKFPLKITWQTFVLGGLQQDVTSGPEKAKVSRRPAMGRHKSPVSRLQNSGNHKLIRHFFSFDSCCSMRPTQRECNISRNLQRVQTKKKGQRRRGRRDTGRKDGDEDCVCREIWRTRWLGSHKVQGRQSKFPLKMRTNKRAIFEF